MTENSSPWQRLRKLQSRDDNFPGNADSKWISQRKADSDSICSGHWAVWGGLGGGAGQAWQGPTGKPCTERPALTLHAEQTESRAFRGCIWLAGPPLCWAPDSPSPLRAATCAPCSSPEQWAQDGRRRAGPRETLDTLPAALLCAWAPGSVCVPQQGRQHGPRPQLIHRLVHVSSPAHPLILNTVHPHMQPLTLYFLIHILCSSIVLEFGLS